MNDPAASQAPPRSETSERSDHPRQAMERAGWAFLLMGFVIALATGVKGVVDGSVVGIVLAIAVMTGFGLTGWLSIASAPGASRWVGLLAVASVIGGGWLLAGFLGTPAGHLYLWPLVLGLMGYAGGAVLAAGRPLDRDPIEWPLGHADTAGRLLYVASWPIMLSLMGSGLAASKEVVMALTVLAGIAVLSAGAGHRAMRLRLHPRGALAATLVALGAGLAGLVSVFAVLSVGPRRAFAASALLVGVLVEVFVAMYVAVSWGRSATRTPSHGPGTALPSKEQPGLSDRQAETVPEARSHDESTSPRGASSSPEGDETGPSSSAVRYVCPGCGEGYRLPKRPPAGTRCPSCREGEVSESAT